MPEKINFSGFPLFVKNLILFLKMAWKCKSHADVKLTCRRNRCLFIMKDENVILGLCWWCDMLWTPCGAYKLPHTGNAGQALNSQLPNYRPGQWSYPWAKFSKTSFASGLNKSCWRFFIELAPQSLVSMFLSCSGPFFLLAGKISEICYNGNTTLHTWLGEFQKGCKVWIIEI